MDRWCCLDNHISLQWVGDVAATQGGASVQLYSKALTWQPLRFVSSLTPTFYKEHQVTFSPEKQYTPFNWWQTTVIICDKKVALFTIKTNWPMLHDKQHVPFKMAN